MIIRFFVGKYEFNDGNLGNLDAVINPTSNGKGLVLTFLNTIHTLECLDNQGKENKQKRGQCAQSKGHLLVFVISGFTKIFFIKFLFHIKKFIKAVEQFFCVGLGSICCLSHLDSCLETYVLRKIKTARFLLC